MPFGDGLACRSTTVAAAVTALKRDKATIKKSSLGRNRISLVMDGECAVGRPCGRERSRAGRRTWLIGELGRKVGLEGWIGRWNDEVVLSGCIVRSDYESGLRGGIVRSDGEVGL